MKTDENHIIQAGKRQIEIVSEEMVEILRRKTPTERLAMGHAMIQFVQPIQT